MKMNMFNKWLDDITPHGDNNVSRYVKVVLEQGQSEEGDGKYELKKKVRLYTDNHVYAIVAIDRGHNDGYLGCVCSLRKPYVGEEHTRGNDLPDGPFNIETWNSIKSAIIARELEPLFESKKSKEQLEGYSKEEAESTGPSLGEDDTTDEPPLHFSEPEKLMTPTCSCEEIGGDDDNTEGKRGLPLRSKLSVQ